jgi:hypothetical protein
MEILIGFFVLSLAFVSLGSYSISQRKGLYKSLRLSDGTQLALTALEEAKAELADTAAFQAVYKQVQGAPKTQNYDRTMNKAAYRVEVTLSRGYSPNNLIKAQAKVTWNENHSVRLGVLIPGPL